MEWYGLIAVREPFPFGVCTVNVRSESIVHVGSQDECTALWTVKNSEKVALQREIDEGRKDYTIETAAVLATRYKTCRVYVSTAPSH